MKKRISYFLILNLFFSIIALSFILNIKVVNAKEECSWLQMLDGDDEWTCRELPDPKNEHPIQKPPPSATLPVATSSLIARKSVININGETGVLQILKDKEGNKVLQLINPNTKEILINKVEPAELTKATADGIWAGYGTGFLGNIAQGLWWASVAVGVIQLVGGFVDDDGALTKALSGAAFGGIVAGKS